MSEGTSCPRNGERIPLCVIHWAVRSVPELFEWTITLAELMEDARHRLDEESLKVNKERLLRAWDVMRDAYNVHHEGRYL